MLSATVETLSVLGDESRLRLCVLLSERELSVGDLVRVTGIPQPRVSTHLARLREGGVVRDRRDGPHAYYQVKSDVDALVRGLLERAAASDDPVLASDRRRLVELERSGRGSLLDAFAGEMERHYSPGRTWQSLALGLSATARLGHVLDAGSGDGAAAALIAGSCETLTLVDENPAMVDAATRRFAKQRHVSVVQADCGALPMKASTFDLALSFHTLTHVASPETVVAESFRVLRPGGRLVVQCLAEHAELELTRSYGERVPGLSPRRVRSLLTRAGFVVARCEIVCREPKKPHFQVVLAVGDKPPSR
jgi:SAM-dependent methyltransferase